LPIASSAPRTWSCSRTAPPPAFVLDSPRRKPNSALSKAASVLLSSTDTSPKPMAYRSHTISPHPQCRAYPGERRRAPSRGPTSPVPRAPMAEERLNLWAAWSRTRPGPRLRFCRRRQRWRGEPGHPRLPGTARGRGRVSFYRKSEFAYDAAKDFYTCPARETLRALSGTENIRSRGKVVT
jgi:hypothetical protein